jgi:hypothetical protein
LILRSSDSKSAHDERECRQWLINLIGVEDERVLSEWVFERHHGSGVTYVQALAAIVDETDQRGRGFINNLIEHAKKPKPQRQAEEELLEYFNRLEQQAFVALRGNRATPESARAEFDKMCELLQEKLRKMFPDVSRSKMKGALVTAFNHVDGKFIFNASRVVSFLMNEPDPLAVNAKASWG